MYQRTLPGMIRRLSDWAEFPESDDCQAYLEYKAWLAEGNTLLFLDQPDPAQVIESKKKAVRQLREQVIDRLAGIAGRAQRKGDTALAAACDTASEALLGITKDLPTEPDAVELELFSRYQVIAYTAIQAAPLLANAFAQVDA